MDIYDRIGHLTNLVILIDYHERLGGTKNAAILAEFNEQNEALLKALKEKHNAARPSEIDDGGNSTSDKIERR